MAKAYRVHSKPLRPESVLTSATDTTYWSAFIPERWVTSAMISLDHSSSGRSRRALWRSTSTLSPSTGRTPPVGIQGNIRCLIPTGGVPEIDQAFLFQKFPQKSSHPIVGYEPVRLARTRAPVEASPALRRRQYARLQVHPSAALHADTRCVDDVVAATLIASSAIG